MVASDKTGFDKAPLGETELRDSSGSIPSLETLAGSRGLDWAAKPANASRLLQYAWWSSGWRHAGVSAGAVLLTVAVSSTLSNPGLTALLAGGVYVAAFAVHLVVAKRFQRSQQIEALLSDPASETLNAFPDGLVVTDAAGRMILVNPSFAAGVGLLRDRLLDQSIDSLDWILSETNSKDDFPWTQAARNSHASKHQLLRYRHPDGGERTFSVSCTPMALECNKSAGALSTFTDVTQTEAYRAEVEHMLAVVRSSRDEMRSINKRLQVLAEEDSLTRCLNRRSLFGRVDKFWQATDRVGRVMACLMLDVDYFKQVNDDYGHPTGDDVLKTVALILKKMFPAPALVGRYGGEEFCVLMPGTVLDEAVARAEQVRQQVEQARFIDHPNLRITISIGAASRSAQMKQIEDLIRRADECLYHAKSRGRNQVVSASDVSS